ncbi:hypothetical protein LCGC14_2360440, partial [marine sediment metagenome]
ETVIKELKRVGKYLTPSELSKEEKASAVVAAKKARKKVDTPQE